MLVVRNCFVAKPGNASKLAAQLKEAAAVAKIPSHRVLTDLTGDFIGSYWSMRQKTSASLKLG